MADALTERAEFAGRLARAAGALANRYFNRELDFVAETKSRQDYVSVADRAVEAFIRAELSRAFPDDTMLGEETGGTVAERTWIVDPIDGTLNFVHGVHYWCVSIAWLEDGQRRIAAIYDPAPDELFVAARGSGAFCNGVPIHVSDCDALDRALHRHWLRASSRPRNAARAQTGLVQCGRGDQGHGRGRADAGARRCRTVRSVPRAPYARVGRRSPVCCWSRRLAAACCPTPARRACCTAAQSSHPTPNCSTRLTRRSA